MTGTPEQRQSPPRRRSDLLCRVIDGEALIYDKLSNLTHRLNDTALFIWEQCNGTRGPDLIAERVRQRYDVNGATAGADVREAIRLMNRNGLLRDAAQDTI